MTSNNFYMRNERNIIVDIFLLILTPIIFIALAIFYLMYVILYAIKFFIIDNLIAFDN
jgi:hypothetical protein